TFRCGEIVFLVEGAAAESVAISVAVQTLPSPLALHAQLGQRRPHAPSPVLVEQGDRFKDKLFVLVRASELLVGPLPLDAVLESLAALSVQALEADRL